MRRARQKLHNCVCQIAIYVWVSRIINCRTVWTAFCFAPTSFAYIRASLFLRVTFLMRIAVKRHAYTFHAPYLHNLSYLLTLSDYHTRFTHDPFVVLHTLRRACVIARYSWFRRNPRSPPKQITYSPPRSLSVLSLVFFSLIHDVLRSWIKRKSPLQPRFHALFNLRLSSEWWNRFRVYLHGRCNDPGLRSASGHQSRAA